jgi:hypothetical protein
MTAAAYGPAVLQAGRDLGITPKGIVIGFATVFVESGWKMYANTKVPDSMNIPHDDVGSDGFSVGLFQQQVVFENGSWWWGDAATCMDPYKSAQLFFTRLARLDYNSDAQSPGSYAQDVQGSAYPDRYGQRMGDAQALYNQLTQGNPPVAGKPDFNEYPKWCVNNQDRTGTKIDLWLIHTQEGGGNADSLANFLIASTGGSNPVSYHYTISQADDGGVTVVDVVDTDQASWSVMNSNNRAINLCFAGSFAAWSRDEWMGQANAIDVAAYLAVQDCIKYGIAPTVIPGPKYGVNPPGISDHRYCTDWLKDGNTHDDVGDNFPWDVFAAAVGKYWNLAHDNPPAPTPTPTPKPVPVPVHNPPAIPKPADPTSQTAQVWDQLLLRWDILGGRTLVEAVAAIGSKLGIDGFKGK